MWKINKIKNATGNPDAGMKGLAHALLIPVLAVLGTGCSGVKTFHEYARAGDTVAVASGWMQNYSADNLQVTITPSTGSPVVLAPGDPSVRAAVNMYVDPLSSMVVSRETGINQTPYATTYASSTGSFTGNDKDWWQTVVFVDLPVSLPTGVATIDLVNPEGEQSTSTVEIISGAGQPSTFHAEMAGPLNGYMLDSLLRVNHYTVSLDGPTIPHSIQLTLTHDADAQNGGVGRAFVVNPVGYIKNAAWSDDGYTTRVLLTPARDASISSMKDYKFYVAGDVQNLAVTSIQAFDIDGYPVTGVTTTVTYYD